MTIICEVRTKSGKTRRIKTTWDWFMNYGHPYVVRILVA